MGSCRSASPIERVERDIVGLTVHDADDERDRVAHPAGDQPSRRVRALQRTGIGRRRGPLEIAGADADLDNRGRQVDRIAVDGVSQTGADAGRGTVFLRVAPSDAEYFDAAMRPSLLRRLAEETGGRFFRSADTSGLVDAISYSGRGVTVIEERELWDMPIVLMLLLALMGGEWLYRRRRGVA